MYEKLTDPFPFYLGIWVLVKMPTCCPDNLIRIGTIFIGNIVYDKNKLWLINYIWTGKNCKWKYKYFKGHHPLGFYGCYDLKQVYPLWTLELYLWSCSKTYQLLWNIGLVPRRMCGLLYRLHHKLVKRNACCYPVGKLCSYPISFWRLVLCVANESCESNCLT